MSAGTNPQNRRLSRESEHRRLPTSFDVGPLHGLLPSFSELIASTPIHHHLHHHIHSLQSLHHQRSTRQPPARQHSHTDADGDTDIADSDSQQYPPPPLVFVPAAESPHLRLRLLFHVTPHTPSQHPHSHPLPSPLLSPHETPNPAMPPTHSPPSGSRGQDYAEDTRRVKRRKLDSDRLPTNTFKGFRYGKYGQVEPGMLKMEISSCDAGIYHVGTSHIPENMLNNYASVYCSRGSRCNVVLKHQGDTVFNLKELVIKTPKGLDFASPVRDGIVFVATSLGELLTRTAEYKMQYVPARQALNTQSGDHDRLADPSFEPPAPSSTFSQRPPIDYGHPSWRARIRRLNIMFEPDEAEEPELKIASMPEEFIRTSTTVRASSQYDYDRELDDVALYNQNPPLDRPSQTPRIGSLPFETDNNEDPDVFGSEDYLSQMIRGAYMPPVSVPFAESFETASTRPASADGRSGDDAHAELMQPLAKFHIERHFNKCTIKFEPPVTGRYILLKMWNAQDRSGSIAIQSVTAKGYAGPRYMPSIQLR